MYWKWNDCVVRIIDIHLNKERIFFKVSFFFKIIWKEGNGFMKIIQFRLCHTIRSSQDQGQSQCQRPPRAGYTFRMV